ncbi:hypothetical protein J2045_003420 [Peteryoungia aggregata LMG 23059]|uniref:Uncharacterized protein n=1 Tax=Peteryoungia aggregata LMG 23059 TaxID=1368425 RepID=A0ABU0GAI9_9HYPH|nr:hypothetical protein [Peteryoungia aggregata]MDQ0422372.1 hypothetical protein [Peteryoungia aggregata LMG 23059]
MADKPDRRKAIPLSVKLEVALRKLGLTIEQIHWDHSPPLALREWDPVKQDTIPPANDPRHIELLLITDHKTKTFGRGGEKRITTAGSDIHAIAKVRRLTKAQEEARRRMLAKTEPGESEPVNPRKKTKWPSRPFQQRKKETKSNGDDHS